MIDVTYFRALPVSPSNGSLPHAVSEQLTKLFEEIVKGILTNLEEKGQTGQITTKISGTNENVSALLVCDRLF